MIIAAATASLWTLSCSEAPAERASTDTVIKEPLFELTLPGPWSRLDATDSVFTYQRADGTERLTVSLRIAKRKLSDAEQVEAMERFVEGARAAERPGATLSDVGRGKMGDRLLARYEGSDGATGRLFTCLVMSNRTVVASFYFESGTGDKKRFLESARAALTDITLRESAAQ
jgi:hypothetical protein